jgi:putative ABC transport system permease protein
MIGLAVRMLLDARMKSLATLAGVVVSVFLMAQQLSTLLGILERVAAFSTQTNVDIWIMPAATESVDLTGTMPMSRVSQARSTPGVDWAAPVIQEMSRITRPDGRREQVKLVGLEAPRYAGLPRSLSAGTTDDVLRGPARVLLNWNDRPTFGSPVMGDRLEIGGRSTVVGGFFTGMDPHAPYSYAFAKIEDVRAITGFPLERTTFVAVGVHAGADIEAVRRSLAQRIADVEVMTAPQFARMEIRYFLQRMPVGVVFGMGTVVAALIGIMIVSITLYSSVLDRLREYGTLKAIGARQRELIRLLLAQAWLFFAAGGAIGLAVFGLVKHLATDAPMRSPPWMLALVLAVSFVSCTLASVIAVRRLLAIDPAIVFRG